MKIYTVIAYFTDLQDDNYPYIVGDLYPREGKTVSAERITELSTSANLRGIPLIKEVRGAEETAKKATISEMETVATTEKNSAVDGADNAVPVEEEPKKRGRKRKDFE